jgi:putative endonuclease
MPRQFWVYILASKSRVNYIGLTGNLGPRLEQHRSGSMYFTRKYRITRLVYLESATTRETAAAREYEIKGWTRAKTNTLVASANPAWDDLRPPDSAAGSIGGRVAMSLRRDHRGKHGRAALVVTIPKNNRRAVVRTVLICSGVRIRP